MALVRKIDQLQWKTSSKKAIREKQDVNDLISEESPLCKFCGAKGIWDHLSTRRILGAGDWIFGFITDPQDVHDPERLECAFCRMVFEVLPETAFAQEHRHLYRSEGASKVYCSLRPIAIKVRGDVFTSFMVAYNFREYVSHTDKLFQNYRAWIGLDSSARRVFSTPGIAAVRLEDKLNPQLVQTWINRCQRHHGACKDTLRRFNYRAQTTMMIDVRRMCLVDAETSWTYAALSYVWGQVQTLSTTKANLETLMTPGALQRADLWHRIPRVIQDSIHLTQSINSRYLWVDCLCILQDDDTSKYEQIASMDAIYFQSRITIIPFNGKNADADIPGARPKTRATDSIPIPSSPSQGEQRNIALICSPEWPSLIHDAVHESRAWTLQEKALSIRCLFISRWGMWFQCLTSRYSDVEPGELAREPETSDELSLLTLHTPDNLSSDDWDGWDQSRMDEFLSFAMHAEWYSGRKLTFQFDRIDAFRGILNLFQDHCQQEFLWAHPEGHLLPISLLWIHVDVGRSRDAKGSTDDIPIYEDYLPDRNTGYPTWSWSGWSGKVSFRLILDMEEAGFHMRLDEDVGIATQISFDEEDAREKGVDQALSPPLFNRTINRGTLELTGPTISTKEMCCGESDSMHLTTLDETSGVFALAHRLYPFSHEGSLTLPQDQMAGPPCGMVFGIPFWGLMHHEHHRFILLKTVPGSISPLFENHASFWSVFQNASGQSVCIAMLIWISGPYAERKGVAIIDQAFWQSRAPVTEEYFLL